MPSRQAAVFAVPQLAIAAQHVRQLHGRMLLVLIEVDAVVLASISRVALQTRRVKGPRFVRTAATSVLLQPLPPVQHQLNHITVIFRARHIVLRLPTVHVVQALNFVCRSA